MVPKVTRPMQYKALKVITSTLNHNQNLTSNPAFWLRSIVVTHVAHQQEKKAAEGKAIRKRSYKLNYLQPPCLGKHPDLKGFMEGQQGQGQSILGGMVFQKAGAAREKADFLAPIRGHSLSVTL